MNKNRQNLIALNTWCYVANFFAMFLNPEFRGPNFSWDEFPRMAQEYAYTDMWINTGLSDTSKNEKKELEFIRATAKTIAEQLIKKAGLDAEDGLIS